jgi:two-component system phosphate regulon response regulator PhoB
MKNKIILIIEDEVAIRDIIQFALTPAGFEIIEAGEVAEAEKKLANAIPDLILLDWMLPDVSGIEFSKRLKRNPLTKHIPIIMLTAKAEEENKIKGLESGADDYVTKPFSPRELIARINTVLRRGPLVDTDGIIQFAKMSINVNNHQVRIDNQLLSLTAIEYKLLCFFVTHPNRIYTREQLLNHVWGLNTYINERTVDVQVKRLRKQLKTYGCEHYLKTVRGSGYQFSETV